MKRSRDASGATATERIQIRICTFNVWRDAPLDGVDATLSSLPHKTNQPLAKRAAALQCFFEAHRQYVDIFALQECTPGCHYLVSQALVGFEPVVSDPLNQEQIFFKRSTLRMLQQHQQLLPGSEGTDGNHMTLARFAVGADTTFVLANTHLSWQGGSQNGYNERYPQMEAVCRAVQDLSEEDKAQFVCGDLNDIYAPLAAAHTTLGALPSFTQVGMVAPHTLPTPAVDPRTEIDNFASKTYDWILSTGATVLSTERLDYQLDGVYPSDHYPVAATYCLTGT